MNEVSEKEQLHRQFVSVSSQLLWQFPDLDFRFCHQSGTNILRCAFEDNKMPAFELELALENSNELIQEASFHIKQIFKKFDA